MPTPIPTQYQDTSKTSFDNFNMPQRQKLGVKVERPSMDALAAIYAGEPTTEQLLNDAKGTLARSFGNDTYAGLERERSNDRGAEADRAAGREQARLEAESAPGAVVRDAVKTGAGIGSMVPGPVGVGSSIALAGVSGYDALNDLMDGDYKGAALESLGVIPALGHGMGAVRSAINAPETAQIARGAVLRKGRETASKMFPEELTAAQQSTDLSAPMSMDKQSSIPPVRHYWDALDEGVDPAKAAKIGAGRDKQSLSALRSLQDAGKQGRSGAWEDLTGEMDSLADTHSAARSRARERFGRSFTSEGSSPAAKSVPRPPAQVKTAYAGAADEAPAIQPLPDNGAPIVREDGIYDPSGRYLAPLAGSLDDIAYWSSRNSRDPRR